MGRLVKFLRLPKSERWLLIQVTFLLSATQIALRLFPFRRVYRWILTASQSKPNNWGNSHLDAEKICAAVNKSGRNIMGANSCFPQALVGEMLLRRAGYPAKLRIGVNKEPGGELKAHAWVELDGSVVIGGPTSLVEGYTPLPGLDQIKL